MSGNNGSDIQAFDQKTQDALKHYVYCLVDPRDKEIFYVGKGQGNRVFNHVYKRREESKKEADARTKRLKEIADDGKSVERCVICHGLEDEDAAFVVESAVIGLLKSGLWQKRNLLNQILGHEHSINETKSVGEIVSMYGLDVFDKVNCTDLLMVVNISRSLRDGDVFAAARGDWTASAAKLTDKRIAGRHYVIAEYNQVGIDIFKPVKWHPKTYTVDGKLRTRLSFGKDNDFKKGSKDYDELFAKYCNKRFVYETGDQSPFHYFGPWNGIHDV